MAILKRDTSSLNYKISIEALHDLQLFLLTKDVNKQTDELWHKPDWIFEKFQEETEKRERIEKSLNFQKISLPN